MSRTLNETTLTEQPAIDWLKELGYEYKFGPDISPGGLFLERENFREVILKKRLKRALQNFNPQFEEKAIDDAIEQIEKIEHPNVEIANKKFYEMLIRGVAVKDEKRGKWDFVKLVDFENPENNDFLVVNQFAVEGIEKVRRPDIVIFLNGIPIALLELKNPTIEEATIKTAYDQVMKEYHKDIPEIFKYNQIIVISDLLEARHGTISSPFEWFKAWRAIEDEKERNEGISELEVLIKGIFHKTRLLDIIENFIIFEKEGEKFIKKMPLYHQYFGVNKAVEATKAKIKPKGDGRIGVFWHTQGSGKSLSMVFYVNKVRKLKEFKNPTFVFLTDRNDLDNQLYKTFKRCGFFAKQAETIRDLREKLKSASGDLIFTTIQKFEAKKGETHPLLSEKENLIVIVDEAHRSQYAILASNAREAMPNASFVGFTATPISLHNRNTRLVFGDYISIYPIDRGVKDKAIVPIYYEGRLVPLHLTNEFIDEDFDYLTAHIEEEKKEKLKRKYAKLEKLVSKEERLKKIADDIVWHFNNQGIKGKAIVATISRKVAVKMYELISKNPQAPEVAVVVSKIEDFKGRIQEDLDIKNIEERFRKPEDPLKIVIVCDMWLTGFDVPCLTTMYIDKPMKNHTLIQAIARVNRIFKDKQAGLIVDYIGIADDLRKALNIYSKKDIKNTLIPLQELINKMLEKYDIVKSYFVDIDYRNWKKLSNIELARLLQKAINQIITDNETGKIDEKKQERFIKEITILNKLWAFVLPHQKAREIRDEVKFFQAVKRVILKRIKSERGEVSEKLETMVKELISKSIAVNGVIDIFEMKGKEKPELSIFDEKFLEELKKFKYPNLAIKILERLLNDELKIRTRKNIIRYTSLKEKLEKIIEEYQKGLISSSEIIKELIKLAKEIKEQEKEGRKLGLSEEELAFYDAVSRGKKYIKNERKLKEIVKELIKIIKKDLTIDWTNNEQIKARIKANVKIVLLQRGYPLDEIKPTIDLIMRQTRNLFQDYTFGYRKVNY